MYKYKAGFVGAGHMGSILAGIACGTAGGDSTAVACSSAESSDAAAERIGCRWDTAENILTCSEYIFIGLRPAQLDGFVKENRPAIEAARGTFVSMLSGVSIAALEEKLGRDKRIIRIMPNTPCEIGKGLIGYACNDRMAAATVPDTAAGSACAAASGSSSGAVSGFCTLLAPAGLIEELPESEMDIFSVIAACAPAYAYYFADALAEGGAQCGMDKEKAVRYAAQMLAGSAGMIMESEKTPGMLRDEVCTPGGTTIEGVIKLRDGGFETLVAEAVKASYNKTVGK